MCMYMYTIICGLTISSTIYITRELHVSNTPGIWMSTWSLWNAGR